MAIRNRIGTYTFEYDGDSIKLQSNLSNIDSLTQDTGKDFHDYMEECSSQRALAKLFFHMQIESDYSEQEIYGAFFGNMQMFMDAEIQNKLQDMTFTLMGMDKAALIKPVKDAKKKARATSSPTKQPSQA